MSKPNNNSSSSSNLSVDSLECEFDKKTSMKDGSEDNVDTILVPFYEKDVLMKVPKEQKNKKACHMQGKTNNQVIEAQSSYLINKQKTRRTTTYLEMFRKQLTPHQKIKRTSTEHEIRSISPEVGDTERESIIDEPNNPLTEFYNTESYNEIYYEKLMSHDQDNYMDNSFEEMPYSEDAGGNVKSPHDIMIENLRSISEVSQPRRHARRATIDPPLDNMKLGGLGPDMEKIKPRLDRARSLQRYSEKVRMENRVRIYKKSVQVDNDKKEKEQILSMPRNSSPSKKEDPNSSYLMNKSSQQKTSQILNKMYGSKSADVKKSKSLVAKRLLSRDKMPNIPSNDHQVVVKDIKIPVYEGQYQGRAKSVTRDKGINTEKNRQVPPVQINFMVNVGGMRPSSALKTLEEKHRLYQEQVKAFKLENGNI